MSISDLVCNDGITILGHSESAKICEKHKCSSCYTKKYNIDYPSKNPITYEGPCACVCNCSENTPIRYVAILVFIEGKLSIPKETTYIVKIWDIILPKSEAYPSSLFGVEQTTQFPMYSAENPIDMDHSYNKVIKKYYQNLISIIPSNYDFKAPCCRKGYISNFSNRINVLLSSEDRVYETENPHVMKRPKGHSHVKI
jgi:hypothetical protein